MKIVKAVLGDIIKFFKPNSHRGAFRFAVLILLVVMGVRFLVPTEEVAESVAKVPTVKTAVVSELSGDSLFELIGVAEAVDKVNITAEVSGRVTKVYVEFGDVVAAGEVIAELENASEYAALLQAEGAYEAALATAASSDIGVTNANTALMSAQNNAIATYRSAYTAVSSVLNNDIDTVFSDPDTSVPGVRIDGGSYTGYLNKTRVSLQSTMPAWQQRSAALTVNDNLEAALDEARTTVVDVLALTNVIIDRLSADIDLYEIGEFAGFRATLIADRTVLNNALSSIDTAETALQQAADAVMQAQFSGTSGELSIANAQVKQALGTLKAAQARYADTIMRTSITGVVNVLEITSGDYVSQQQLVATVANNNALEVTTYVGENDRQLISVGQSVMIDNAYKGVITAIAPAISPVTKKIEVKIQTESDALTSGDTVSLSINRPETTDVSYSGLLRVPLTAVKFAVTNGSVFVVSEGSLEAIPVTVGAVSGDMVEVSGIEATTVIVVDARGLVEGQSVEAVTE